MCSFKADDKSCLRRHDKLHYDTKYTLEDCRLPAAHGGTEEEWWDECKGGKKKQQQPKNNREIETDEKDLQAERE